MRSNQALLRRPCRLEFATDLQRRDALGCTVERSVLWANERANDLFLRGYHHNDKQRAKPLPRRIPIPSAQSTTRANPQSRRARHIYSSSSLLSLADLLITFTLSCCARSTIALRFRVETLWATSAQYFLLCIMRRSRSATLWTTNL